MMLRIELQEEVWRQVLACIAKQPWEIANPLIMAIGQQMQAQTPAAAGLADPTVNQAGPRRGNSADAEH